MPSVPLWVQESAEGFWVAAGGTEPFPRTLHGAIARALPVSVVYQAHLHVAGVQAWLADQRIVAGLTVSDRALRACLVARRGHGLIFLDGSDPEDERRFSLAHELAHYLLDYWQPRQRAARRVGHGAYAVLDGDRSATADERIHSALARIALDAHTHLLARDTSGTITDPAVREAERRADRLAWELLAPAHAVIAVVSEEAGYTAVMPALRARFGLPHAAAAAYASTFVPSDSADSPLLRRLGIR